ncbi:MAG TPA: HD domain-containing phosphohydrolase [Aromatoleum sp.]|uniref:HD-GYP domain-containing protein n=1 Tax=Aromatoleum sp. TaxID=2307007 RepID=UPI002B49BDCF|nr:HD domain-containing phosphohydrolase [Aromatoleum sp.]HJV28250.1 HD domain-containing phosphohydrolase [Aromatoleum sp.]
MLFNSVNEHCLNSIVELSETHTVEASEDIYDERGMKLWAKGKPVSAELQEKLLRRKLAKPLEATLAVDGAVAFGDVVGACRTRLDENPLFRRIVNRDAISLINGMRNTALPQPLRLLLTSAHAKGSNAFKHAVGTILVSAGIAARLSVSEHDAQHLLMAALLHDLGEMYINPDYLRDSYRLPPAEWKHVASHPRIGQLLIAELTTLPAIVGQCVAQHHERLDGSGYPNQLERSKHQRLGSWLAVADSVAAILSRGDAGAPLRAALAMRIVPEEFDHDAVAVVTQALRHGDDSFGTPADGSFATGVKASMERVVTTIRRAESLRGAAATPFLRQTAETALQLLYNLDKSLRSTGVVEAATLGADVLDAEVVAEINLVVREVDWRMRNLARNLHLRAEAHDDKNCLPHLSSLIGALDGTAPS